jgi:hypothetical protein
MKTNNELIAEFMGLNKTAYKDTPPIMSNLKYHTLWDWLMPVVENILNVCSESDNMESYYTIVDGIPNIEATYKAVVEFIKWYNQQAKMKIINFKKITLRQALSSRGGGIEIDLTSLGFKGERMAAYQNYLGGGMLGAIQCNSTVNTTSKKLNDISEQLMRYFHSLTNHEDDEWESATFEQNQNRPKSAY